MQEGVEFYIEIAVGVSEFIERIFSKAIVEDVKWYRDSGSIEELQVLHSRISELLSIVGSLENNSRKSVLENVSPIAEDMFFKCLVLLRDELMKSMRTM